MPVLWGGTQTNAGQVLRAGQLLYSRVRSEGTAKTAFTCDTKSYNSSHEKEEESIEMYCNMEEP